MLNNRMRALLPILLLLLLVLPPLSAGGEQEAPPEQEGSHGGDSAAPAQADGTAPAETETGIPDSVRSALQNAGLQVLDRRIPSEDFALTNLAGEERNLSFFAGQVVVLNFWASWCGPCVAEMPAMEALYRDIGGDDFTIIGVNVQEQGSVARNFVEQNGITFPILLDRSGSTARRYGVRGLPTSYVIAPDGTVIAAKIGYHEWDTPEARALVEEVHTEL